jgi:hypothetical protein
MHSSVFIVILALAILGYRKLCATAKNSRREVFVVAGAESKRKLEFFRIS